MKRLIPIILLSLLACTSSVDSNKNGVNEYALLSQEDLNSALDDLNLQIRNNINEAELYWKRSRLFEAAGEYQGALADIDRAIKIDQRGAKYYLQKGALMVKLSDFKQAENAFVRCAQLDEDNVECRLREAEYLLYTKRYNDAMIWVNKVLRIDKHNADAYFLKGMIHLNAGDKDLAETSLMTAVEQNPDLFDAYFQLGTMFAEKGSPLAIEYYNNAIRISPQRVEPYYNKGLIAQELGEYNEALKSYSDLIKIDPNYKDAHFNMGYVNMYYLKLYNQGTVHFTDAINVDPKFYQAYYNRGYCYELLGDVKRALIDYDNALKIQPNYTLAAEGKERVTAF